MWKRSERVLQKMMAVLLSVALAAGTFLDAAPARALAEESEAQGAITEDTAWDEDSVVGNVTIRGGATEQDTVTIAVTGSATVTGTITVESGYVKFTGGSLKWQGSLNNALIVKEGADVRFENVTLDGSGVTEFEESALIFHGAVTLGQGTTVQNFRSKTPEAGGSAAGRKGVIAVYERGSLTVTKGVYITGNSSESGIIAIYQEDKNPNAEQASTARMTMSGGTIAGNTVENPNLGVVWNWCGRLVISGGRVTAEGNEYAVFTQGNAGKYDAATEISGGTFTGGGLGAVCAGKDSTNNSKITITGGTFQGKVAATVNYGTIDIRGGSYEGTEYALQTVNMGAALNVSGGEFYGKKSAYSGNVTTQTEKVIVGESKDALDNWDKTTDLAAYRYVAIGELPPKHQHTLERHEAVPATCTAAGTGEYFSCEGTDGCGAMFSDSEGKNEIMQLPAGEPKKEHSYSAVWERDETNHWHECAACGARTGEASHVEDGGSVTQSPTDTAPGVRSYCCEECGYLMREEIIDKLEYFTVEVSVGENGEGSIQVFCDGNPIESSTSQLKGAGITVQASAEPGYLFAGWMENDVLVSSDREYTFTLEGDRSLTAAFEAHPHDFDTAWSADGTAHWHECACGERSEEAAHTEDAGTVTKEPSETEAGVKTYRCSVCGRELRTEELPATGGDDQPDTGDDQPDTGDDQPDAGDEQPDAGDDQPDAGRLELDVLMDERAPEAQISTPKEELTDCVLTPEEKQQWESGTDIRVVLDIKEASESVGSKDKTLVEAKLAEDPQVKNYKVGQYLDINLFKLIAGERRDVTKTNVKLRITIAVPDGLKNAGAAQSPDFAIIRVHEGAAEVLDDLDGNPETITIETDRFSTYVIVCSDTADNGDENNKAGGSGSEGIDSGSGTGSTGEPAGSDAKPVPSRDPEPKTGDGSSYGQYATLAMIAGFAYLLLYFGGSGKGMTEETKKELVAGIVSWAKKGGRMRRLAALSVIFLLLLYYHVIGKRLCSEWKDLADTRLG